MRTISVVKSDALSKGNVTRFVVIDRETKEILDDAQGYGFKSIDGAYKAYIYWSHQHEKQVQIQQWLKENPVFVSILNDTYRKCNELGHRPSNIQMIQYIEWLLSVFDLKIDCSTQELVREWKHM